MWQNLILPLIDLFNMSRATAEERAELLSNVTKLRQTAKAPRVVFKNNASSAFAYSGGNSKPISLFHSIEMPGPGAMSERKRVGHWCTMSVPASREPQSKRSERAYDADFRTMLEPQDLNLEAFLTRSAGQKAIQTYVLNNSARKPSVVPASAPSYQQSPSLEDSLMSLARSDEEMVRISVASNEHIPVGAMWLLVDDASPDVKLELIRNQKTSIAMLEHMSNDAEGRVARRAQSKLRMLYQDHFGIATGNLSAQEAASEQAESRRAPEIKTVAAA